MNRITAVAALMMIMASFTGCGNNPEQARTETSNAAKTPSTAVVKLLSVESGTVGMTVSSAPISKEATTVTITATPDIAACGYDLTVKYNPDEVVIGGINAPKGYQDIAEEFSYSVPDVLFYSGDEKDSLVSPGMKTRAAVGMSLNSSSFAGNIGLGDIVVLKATPEKTSVLIRARFYGCQGREEQELTGEIDL